MYFLFSKSGLTKIWIPVVLSIIVIIGVVGAFELSRLSWSSPTSLPSPTIAATPTNVPVSNPNQKPTSTTTPAPTPNPTPTSTNPIGEFINVTGYAQYELSPTEFVFNTGTRTYNVTMDLTTQAINLNGKLLGGYQIVSQIIPVTSLPLTITGTVNSSTIMAQTVLIPTTKDKIT